ncbi:hypothetical protein F5141DRAFT_1063461 [Pisolithus sp. B1]|nr:hypothetical protein F5141DRAFT_1063456 [Pisolithus sp. B1]KAI6111085.1 hypothetical protein F5141DRAFT_1063461 [Pisolithus sp. B1]
MLKAGVENYQPGAEISQPGMEKCQIGGENCQTDMKITSLEWTFTRNEAKGFTFDPDDKGGNSRQLNKWVMKHSAEQRGMLKAGVGNHQPPAEICQPGMENCQPGVENCKSRMEIQPSFLLDI